MFARYTQDAKKAIYIAAMEANHRGEEFVTATDLLLGLCRVCPSRAHRIAELCEKRVGLRAALGIPHLPITARPYKLEPGAMKLDDDSKKTLAYAYYEADERARFWIDTDSLLCGILRFENPASKVLQEVGMTLPELRRKAKADRREYRPESVPFLLLFRLYGLWLVVIGIVVAILFSAHWYLR